MKKLFFGFIAVAMLMAGCGRIETGNVGLRTDFNGTVSEKIEQPGFYTAVLGHVDQFTIKEIPINLENLTPKAHDNLSLRELDVTVYYSVAPSAIRDLAVKRTGQSADSQHGFYYPGYFLVESVSKSEIADAVSKLDSLTIHTQRDKLANDAKQAIQASLDQSMPNAFTITRVVVRQVSTDPTIEASIRNVVSKEKELEASKLQVAIAKSNAEATQQTALTLTPAFLQHEYNQALMKFAEHGGTVILDGSASSKMINLTK